MTERIDYIDQIKGFSILWVVMYHFGDFIPDIMQVPFRLPLFFLVSGFFFRERSCFKDFVIKKVNTLLLPFCFFYIIGTCWTVIVNALSCFYNERGLYEFACRMQDHFLGLTKLCFVSVNADVQNHLGVGAIWFLLGLFFIQITYWLMRRMTKNTIVLISISFLLYLLSIFLIQNHVAMDSLFYSIYSLQFLFYYVLGHLYCGKFLSFIKDNHQKEKEFFISAFIVLSILSFVINIDNPIVEILKVLSFSIIIFISFRHLAKFRFMDIFSFYGKNSLILLGTHMIIISAFAIMDTLFFAGRLNSAFSFIHVVLFVAILLMSNCFIFVFTKYLPWAIGKKEVIKYSKVI